MPTTRSRTARERTHTEGSSQLGPIMEEANPFASISQAFAPYSESISAISGSRRRPSAFGPATVRAPAVTGVSLEPVFGSTVSGEYVYQTMLTQSGEELTVLTPRTRRTNTTVTNLPPTVLFPETRHPTTPIRSVHSDHADDDLYEDRTRDIRSGHNTPSGPPPGGNTPDDPGDGDGPPDPPGPPGGGPPGGGPNPPNPGSSRPGNDDDDTFNQFRNTMSSFQSTLAGLGQIISTATQPKPDDSKRNKVKDPEVFDGSDPRKLKTFFVNLALVFLEKPDYYTDQRKIHYTLSYLSGTAKEWFEPDILDPDPFNPPAWSISFPALVKELQENFGLYDAQGEAESCLGNIQMHTNEQVRKYNIRFNTLAALTNWNESALKWAYKNGLVDRIKDELARIPEPATLAEFRQEVLRIDDRHWKREFEKRRASGKSGNSGNKDKGNQGKKGQSSQSNSGQQKTNNQQSSTSNMASSSLSNNRNTSGNNSGNQKPGKSNNNCGSFSHLGPDGKLTQAEKERRKKNKLCMFCGGSGHNFDNCLNWKEQNTNSNSHGRASTVESTSTAAAGPSNSSEK